MGGFRRSEGRPEYTYLKIYTYLYSDTHLYTYIYAETLCRYLQFQSDIIGHSISAFSLYSMLFSNRDITRSHSQYIYDASHFYNSEKVFSTRHGDCRLAGAIIQLSMSASGFSGIAVLGRRCRRRSDFHRPFENFETSFLS